MTQTTLIIARHGNTFREGQTPTRVGARTNLPLVEKGEEQALRLGHRLQAENLIPDVIFTSSLQRTIQTAHLACVAMACQAPSHALRILDEIDYGPDENHPESDVIARLGADALHNWDESGIMPDDWSPRPEIIRKNWQDFANSVDSHHAGKCVLVVTSNGIARFALDLAPSRPDEKRKLATGAYGVLTKADGATEWSVQSWNIRP